MKILVTGGAGYIGSHTLLQLLYDSHDVLVFDNFSNSSPEALRRVKELSNVEFDVCEGDIRDTERLQEAFNGFKPEAVIHLAGLKAVGESNEQPVKYYSHNVGGSIELLQAMTRHNCRRIIFSSSATVYGKAHYLPYDELHPLQPTNSYGRSKYFVEEIIRDWACSGDGASAVLLRYFNPVGADASGRIGEDPKGKPGNLIPHISQVAIGRSQYLNVYGSDYGTRDGTGERDYIHVEDLALAHLAAIEFSLTFEGCEAINIGTGVGYTVLEMVKAFEHASGRAVPFRICPRRDGDVASSVASVSKAESYLGWKAKLGLADMCRTTWNWQSCNPSGYRQDQPLGNFRSEAE